MKKTGQIGEDSGRVGPMREERAAPMEPDMRKIIKALISILGEQEGADIEYDIVEIGQSAP